LSDVAEDPERDLGDEDAEEEDDEEEGEGRSSSMVVISKAKFVGIDFGASMIWTFFIFMSMTPLHVALSKGCHAFRSVSDALHPSRRGKRK